MMNKSLAVLSMATLSLAQSSTVSLFLLGSDPQSLIGSAIGADSTGTTYVLHCGGEPSIPTSAGKQKRQAAATTNDGSATASPYGAAATTAAYGGSSGGMECGFPGSVTVTQGPSTVLYAYTDGSDTASVHCDLSGTTQAACTVAGQGPDLANVTGTDATTTFTGSEVSRVPVVITSGLSFLNNVAASSTPTSSGGSMESKSGTATGTSGGKATGTSSTQSTATPAGGNSKAAGSSSGVLHLEPAVGMGIAGIIAVAVAAAML